MGEDRGESASFRRRNHGGFFEAHAGGGRLMASCVQRQMAACVNTDGSMRATAAMRQEHQYRRQENAAAAAAEAARARGFFSLLPLLRLPSLSLLSSGGHAHSLLKATHTCLHNCRGRR